MAYTGTILAAAGIYPSVAIVLSWPANNVSGQTKRCVANALQISVGNLGAVIGTQLYREDMAPRFFLGHSFALGYLVANLGVVGLLWTVLHRENRRKEQLRQETGVETLSASGGVGETDEFDGDADPRWVFET